MKDDEFDERISRLLSGIRPPATLSTRIQSTRPKLGSDSFRVRPRKLALAAAALAVAVIGSLLYFPGHSVESGQLARSSAHSQPRSSATGPRITTEGPVGKDGSPFNNGTKYPSLALADSTSGVDVSSMPRPNDQLASDGQIKDVWVDASSDQPKVRIDYSSGIYVELETAPDTVLTPDGAKATFASMAAQDAQSTNGQARVISIGSAPAYLVPSDSGVYANGQSQGNAGYVEFVSGSQIVDVVGHFSDAELIRVATSAMKTASS